MAENLKVNAKSKILTFKKKHNLLVDGVPQKNSDGNYEIFEKIVDKDGHQRFVEGNIEISNYFVESITPVYCKWSLSGSNLLIVVCGIVASGTELTAQKSLTKLITLPQWILDKIYPIVGNVVSTGATTMWAQNYQNAQLQYNVVKAGTSAFLINVGTTVTATGDMQFRIQFDLLIDNAVTE